MWRTRALEAEAKATDTHSLPEFLRAICRNTVLTGDQKKHRSWSVSAMSLSFVLYATWAKAYRFLKSNFAFPLVSLIFERIDPILHSREHNALSTDEVRAMPIGSCRLECTERMCPVKPDSTIDETVSIHGGGKIVRGFQKP
jgi:hypothetical protein